MAATEPVYVGYLNYIGSGAPADGDQITRDNSTYPLNTVYTDRDSGITYVRKATTKVAATDWQAGGGGSSEVVTVLSNTVTLTHADILALPSNGYDNILPILETGKVYVFLGGAVNLNWSSNYGNVSGTGSLQILQGDEQRPISTKVPNWIFVNDSNTTGFLVPLTDIVGSDQFGQIHPTTDFTGAGFRLGCANGGLGDFTGGGSGDTLKITVVYTILSL
jgi:hypothetical protein